MAPTSNETQLTTRSQNATAHPGKPDVPKRKRRTQAQIAADKKAAEEAKAAEETRKIAGMKRIAKLESKMDQDDANDVTPKAKSTSRQQPLRRTSSHYPLFDSRNPDFSEPLTEPSADGIADEYEQPTEAESQTEDDGEQPTKKAKKDKGKTRAAIKAVGKEMVHEEERLVTDKNEFEGKNMIVDRDSKHGNIEADHGTGNRFSGFVFPFSSYHCFLHAHA